MSRNLIAYISNIINRLENILPIIFHRGRYPPAPLAICGSHDIYENIPQNGQNNKIQFNIKDLIGDGFLWAVPKHRRTVEKRLIRKFGSPEYNWKPLRVKRNLRTCTQCGHYHEMGVLCPLCYDKVRQETKQMQEKIQEQLGLYPIEQEIIVLYKGEKKEQTSEMLNGKRIIEIDKPRPMWFSKNLMQKSTQPSAITKEVKPSELG